MVSIHGPRVIMDIGIQDHLIPGMRGYIIARDDSIRTSDNDLTQHYVYLALFQIIEVYRTTCTGEILFPPKSESPIGFPDIKVGDEVILK